MKRTNLTVTGLILMVVLCGVSCSGKLDKEAFVEWVRDYDNGLHTRKQSGDFIFDLQYQPPVYIMLQRNADASDTAKLREIEGLQYYTLTVSLTDPNIDFINYNVRDQVEKQKKLYYFSYLFQQDIRLEEDGEVLPCTLLHFERAMDLKNSRTFVLAFENHKKDPKETRLVIQSPSFGSLPVKIKVSKENIPAVKL